MDNLFAIAKVTRASGLNGEVRVRPLSRYFESYVEEKPLFIGLSKDMSREVRLEQKIGIGKKVRFQFDGVTSRDDAEALIGQYVYAEVTSKDEIHWIAEELLGADIISNDGNYIGVLSEILWLPNNDVYVIKSDNREILIPVIPEIVTHVDLGGGVIVITPMDGLLD